MKSIVHIVGCALLVLCGPLMNTVESRAQAVKPKPTPVPHTPSIDRGSHAYLKNDCYSCHGGYDVPDVRHGFLAKSSLVQIDNDGSILRKFISTGSPCAIATDDQDHAMMPGYWDMPAAEMTDLINYIHFTRQELRFRELSSEALTAGNSGNGADLFKGKCAQCHTGAKLMDYASKSDMPALRTNILFPRKLTAASAPANKAGTGAHRLLLERYSSQDVSDLVAYLKNHK